MCGQDAPKLLRADIVNGTFRISDQLAVVTWEVWNKIIEWRLRYVNDFASPITVDPHATLTQCRACSAMVTLIAEHPILTARLTPQFSNNWSTIFPICSRGWGLIHLENTQQLLLSKDAMGLATEVLLPALAVN